MRRTSAADRPREQLRVRRASRARPGRRLRATRGGRTRARIAPASARTSGRRSRRRRSAIDAGSTSAAAATSSSIARWHGWSEQPVALDRPTLGSTEREEARVLAGAVVLDALRADPALEVVLGRRRRGENRRTTASCSGVAPCEAQASATCSSSRSGRARTTGSAWSGFADERRYVTSPGSPAASSTRPSRTATAWTTCRASTTSPRVTSTTIGSTAREPSERAQAPSASAHARATRGRGMGARARPARVPRAGRVRATGPYRDAEDVRSAAERARGARFAGSRRRGRTSSFPPTTASSCSAST